MSNTLIILNQVTVMFILMMVGFFLAKKAIISDKTAQEVADVVIYLVTPSLIITSLQIKFTEQTLHKALMVGFLAIVTTLLIILLSRFLSPKNPLSQYNMIFGNTGFIGIPIVQSLYGDEAVVYMAVFIAVVNLIVWTYGLALVAGKNAPLSFAKIATNPNNLAIFIGVFLNILSISLPAPLAESMHLVANLNLPFVMLVLGTYLAEAHLSRFFSSWEFYKTCVLRLLVIPSLVLVLMKVLPLSIDPLVAGVIVIAHATPGALLLAVFAKKFQQDYQFSLAIISLTTLLSLVTMPVMITLTNYILG